MPAPSLHLSFTFICAMAVPAAAIPPPAVALLTLAQPDEQPTGPDQSGRGNNGQYVYWIVFAHPTDSSIQRLGLRSPAEFTRNAFSQLAVQVHKDCGVHILETANFLELHASGKPHLNVLARASSQYRWKKIAEAFFNSHRIRVNFAPHIKKWVDGIVYGCVASEHKGPHELDQSPTQWAEHGHPLQFDEVLPKKWRAQGFVRKVKMTHFTFLDTCRRHGLRNERDLWALAGDLEQKGDGALTSFMMENDVGVALERVAKAMDAKEATRRSKMTRLEILQEYRATKTCTCSQPGSCYKLMKEVLGKNGVDGEFQKLVVATLSTGREKATNLCIVGGTNMAKSFVLKPLFIIYKTYTRPDGGSYQLENLLGKEVVFLNDFEYDESAQKWMPWQYFKNFLEGEKVAVARPKNRGGNVDFESDAPVFMTAPQEVALYRGKLRDEYETSQMNSRVKYIPFRFTFSKQAGVPEVKPCGHCGARVYLEGCDRVSPANAATCPILDSLAASLAPFAASSASAASSSTPTPLAAPSRACPILDSLGYAAASTATSCASASSTPPSKKPRLASDTVKALVDAKALKDHGCIGSPEFAKLKESLLRGE